jgi:hypothetical protein
MPPSHQPAEPGGEGTVAVAATADLHGRQIRGPVAALSPIALAMQSAERRLLIGAVSLYLMGVARLE